MTALSHYFDKSVLPPLHSLASKIEKNFSKVRHVCQSIFNTKLNLYIFGQVLFLPSMLKVKLTWMIPGLVASVLARGTCPVSRGGDRGTEEVFLTVTVTRSWPAPPPWPPPPPPASLSSGLESPENWKEKIFALKSFLQKLFKYSKRGGTISLKFSNPISLKLNVILNHLQQTRFTNPDKTL